MLEDFCSTCHTGRLGKSSNIGAAKIGMKLGGPLLRDYIAAFGLGTRTTGISLPH